MPEVVEKAKPQDALAEKYDVQSQGDDALEEEFDTPVEPEPSKVTEEHGVKPAQDAQADAPNPAKQDASLAASPATAATSPAVAPTSTPAATKHFKSVLRLAREYGLSEAEIESSAPEELAEKVSEISGQFLRAQREFAAQAGGATQTPPAAPPASSPTVATGKAGGFDTGLDPKVYEKDVIEAFQKLHDTLASRIQQLEGHVKFVAEREVTRERETLASQIDQVFDGLGEAFVPFLGKGRGREMDGESPEYQSRIAVLRMADAMPQTEAFNRRVEKAAKLLFGRVATVARDKAEKTEPDTKTAEKWRGGGVAKPTSRESPEPRGTQRALKTAARVMKEHGLLSDEESADGFLD